jgi:hypothetical protein
MLVRTVYLALRVREHPEERDLVHHALDIGDGLQDLHENGAIQPDAAAMFTENDSKTQGKARKNEGK